MIKLILGLIVFMERVPLEAMDYEGKEVPKPYAHTFINMEDEEEADPDLTTRFIPWEGSHRAHPTSNNFGTSSLHGYVQPEFISTVLEKPHQEVLEVGPADGLVLEEILKDERNLKTPIRYTMVEPSTEHLTAINKVIKTYNKNKANWFGQAKNGDIREFIKGKENKYDLILCSQVLHFLDPLDQLSVLQGLQKSLKDGGRIFLIINGLFSINLWVLSDDPTAVKTRSAKYIQTILDKQRKGDLWAGYNFDQTFSAQWIEIARRKGYPYDLLTFHSPSSFASLLRAVGFNIDNCCNFSEIIKLGAGASVSREEQGMAASIRVGAIAQKSAPDKKNISIYTAQAYKKRQEKINLAQMIEEFRPFLELILRNMGLDK